MRKYRNGKQSREPRQLSKYSPEYIQYRGNRGGYSVKVGLCDITGDGDADTISVAWRNPANGKVENCTVSIPQAQAPTSGPSNLTATEAVPASGPSNLIASEQLVAPTSGPSNLTASESVPASGPSSLTASESVPATGDESSFSISSTVSLDMIYVESGTFTMGSPTTEPDRDADETQHQVQLTKDFYLGKYEVTQAQYEAVMTGNTDGLSATPSTWQNNPNRPVETVSHDDIQIFLSRLNNQQSANIPAGWAYVLPTESQWEYACRAGTTTMYSWGNIITSSNANYNLSIGQTSNVGNYAANPWGFFDMHGNVWEWTADWYQAAYPTGNPVIDPTGPASGSLRVARGGSAYNSGLNLRSATRNNQSSNTTPGYRTHRIGFRVALTQIESVPATGPSGLTATEESTTITFDADNPATLSGHTDSQSRQWFVTYSSVGGYVFNVNPNGTAYITDPNGVSTDVTDSNTTVPDTDGLSMISNISAYDYSGNGDTEVASFDYIPTPAP